MFLRSERKGGRMSYRMREGEGGFEERRGGRERGWQFWHANKGNEIRHSRKERKVGPRLAGGGGRRLMSVHCPSGGKDRERGKGRMD